MTATNKQTLERYLHPRDPGGILIGIGGVSMRPLGLVLRHMGLKITGSDMNASVMTDDLIESGIPVFIGHRAENIRGAQCIIRTAAVHNDNPEVAAARAAGIPVFERAQAWGIIMRAYRNAICLSGTHGKTTTTSMVTHIFMQAQRDPTVMIGGYLPLLHAGHRVGKGDTIIMESCEYCNSFLNFFPTIAVILNIEADHLDFFKDLRDVQASFRRFAQLVPAGGMSSPTAMMPTPGGRCTGSTISPLASCRTTISHGENYTTDWRDFDVIAKGKFYCHVHLNVVGQHNTYNALAAAACGYLLGIDGADVAAGLGELPRRGAAHGAQGRISRRGHL